MEVEMEMEMPVSPVTNIELQAALAPLIKSIDRIESDLGRMDDRIAHLPDVYMTRADYKDRHDDVVTAVRQLQSDAARQLQWANDQHTIIKADFLKEIQAVRTEIKTINDASLSAQSASTRWLVTLICTPVAYFIIEVVAKALHLI